MAERVAEDAGEEELLLVGGEVVEDLIVVLAAEELDDAVDIVWGAVAEYEGGETCTGLQ
jgi:hypothetical protein